MLKINKVFAYLYGYWLGDGIKGSSSLLFSAELKNISWLENKILQLIAIEAKCQGNTIWRFKGGSLLQKAFQKASYDTIKQYPIHFIGGFLDSDGSVDLPYSNKKLSIHEQKCIRVCFFNTDKHKLLDIQKALTTLNIRSSFVKYYPHKNGYNPITKCNAKKCYRLHVTDRKDLYKLSLLLKNVVFKSERLEQYKNSYEIKHRLHRIQITEIFESVQGEIDCGLPSIFIRVAHCDIKPLCQFCDSKFTLKKGIGYTVSQLMSQIELSSIKHVVWTGGSPSLYMNLITQCVDLLPNYEHTLETNGIKYFDVCKKFTRISVSPKKQHYDISALRKFAQLPQSRFKFVYENDKDLWWEPIIQKLNLSKDRVYIMPEGKTKKEQIEKGVLVAEYCKKRQYWFAPRIQVLIWGNRRKV